MEGRRRRKPQRAAATGRPERSPLNAPEERVARGAQDRRATPVRNAHGEARTGKGPRVRGTGDDNGHGASRGSHTTQGAGIGSKPERRNWAWNRAQHGAHKTLGAR